MAKKLSPTAWEMMRLKRENPDAYTRKVAAASLRVWIKHLRAARRGEGFYKVDHCEAMIALHLSRYRTPK